MGEALSRFETGAAPRAGRRLLVRCARHLRSTARLFAHTTRPFLAACYAATLALLGLSGWLAGLGVLFWPGLLLPAALLAWQVRGLDMDEVHKAVAEHQHDHDHDHDGNCQH